VTKCVAYVALRATAKYDIQGQKIGSHAKARSDLHRVQRGSLLRGCNGNRCGASDPKFGRDRGSLWPTM